MKRRSAVAGSFYPASKEGVESQIDAFDVAHIMPGPALGVVAPHAGYIYSGPVAAKVYAGLEAQGPVILIGPNHGSGRGLAAPPVAIMAEGEWELPAGTVPINARLAKTLMENAPIIEEAGWAHESEHSLEVQVPFLQRRMSGLSIVPIILARLPDDMALDLANGIYKTVAQWEEPVTLVASTDFSHYVPHDEASRLDHMAIEKIQELDATGLIEVVRNRRISMCGVQPTAVVIEVCRKLGATEATLISYQTSGDTSGDYSSVVGYGGLVIKPPEKSAA